MVCLHGIMFGFFASCTPAPIKLAPIYIRNSSCFFVSAFAKLPSTFFKAFWGFIVHPTLENWILSLLYSIHRERLQPHIHPAVEPSLHLVYHLSQRLWWSPILKLNICGHSFDAFWVHSTLGIRILIVCQRAHTLSLNTASKIPFHALIVLTFTCNTTDSW